MILVMHYFILLIALFGCTITPLNAAPTRIEITKGKVQPDPIAIISFTNGTDKKAAEKGEKIAEIIANDLRNCGLFMPIDKSVFIQTADEIQTKNINFPEWQKIGTRFIVTGTVILNSSSTMTIEFRLFDILDKKKMIAQSITGDREKIRYLAHAVADQIYTRITTEAGYFNTHIVYSETHGPDKKRTSRLVFMDYDGHNARNLTSTKNLVLTPRFSPTGKEIAYLKYEGREAHVFVMNVTTKAEHKLGKIGEMNFAPRFSPDASAIIMSLIKDGSSAIYTMNLAARKLVRLTDHISIDTSPCYAPDGKQITFTSDRSGQEKIYVMNANGSDVKRISFGDGQYSQPVWSPRSDLIAFTKRAVVDGQSRFFIGVMSPDGTNERMIADGWLVEDPCWSSNGRYLIFTKQTSINQKAELYMVDLTGYNLHKIETKGNASNGAWSPIASNIVNPINTPAQQ